MALPVHAYVIESAPRMACAAVYQVNKKKMEFLWGEKLRINTVHVLDVCQAMWVAATELKPGTVYNLADESDMSTQMYLRLCVCVPVLMIICFLCGSQIRAS